MDCILGAFEKKRELCRADGVRRWRIRKRQHLREAARIKTARGKIEPKAIANDDAHLLAVSLDEHDTVAAVRVGAKSVGLRQKPIKLTSKVDTVLCEKYAPNRDGEHSSALPPARVGEMKAQ